MTGRRVSGRPVPRLVGRPPNDWAEELQTFLEELQQASDEGIPAGFNDLTPTNVAPGAIGDAGTESEGWAASDHQHELDIGAADATDGQVLTRDSSAPGSTAWADPTGGSGGGGAAAVLDLVESKDFLVDATEHIFTGLDGDVDERYFLAYNFIKGSAAAGMTVVVQPNSISTNQASWGRYDGTPGSAVLGPYATLQIANDGTVTTGDTSMGTCWFDAKTGKNRSGRANWTLNETTNVYAMTMGFVWRETTTNITSLRILSDLANGIGAGSWVGLYKLRKVAGGAGAADEAAVVIPESERMDDYQLAEATTMQYPLRDIIARTYYR